MIIKVENGKIVNKNVSLSTEFPNTSFPTTITQGALPPGYFLVETTKPPIITWDQTATKTDPIFKDGKWVDNYTVTTLTDSEKAAKISQAKSNLKYRVAAMRYEKSLAGVVVNGNGFSTDATTSNTLNNYSSIAATKPDFTVNWKTTSGNFVTLTSVQISEAATAVSTFIESQFSWEKDISSKIDSVTTWEGIQGIQRDLITASIGIRNGGRNLPPNFRNPNLPPIEIPSPKI